MLRPQCGWGDQRDGELARAPRVLELKRGDQGTKVAPTKKAGERDAERLFEGW